MVLAQSVGIWRHHPVRASGNVGIPPLPNNKKKLSYCMNRQFKKYANHKLQVWSLDTIIATYIYHWSPVCSAPSVKGHTFLAESPMSIVLKLPRTTTPITTCSWIWCVFSWVYNQDPLTPLFYSTHTGRSRVAHGAQTINKSCVGWQQKGSLIGLGSRVGPAISRSRTFESQQGSNDLPEINQVLRRPTVNWQLAPILGPLHPTAKQGVGT